MQTDVYKKKIVTLLSHADVSVEKDRPWDMQVHNSELYARIIGGGTIGLGEAYMDGWWDCEALDDFFTRVLDARLASRVHTLKDKWFFLTHHLINKQRGKNAYKVGKNH